MSATEEDVKGKDTADDEPVGLFPFCPPCVTVSTPSSVHTRRRKASDHIELDDKATSVTEEENRVKRTKFVYKETPGYVYTSRQYADLDDDDDDDNDNSEQSVPNMANNKVNEFEQEEEERPKRTTFEYKKTPGYVYSSAEHAAEKDVTLLASRSAGTTTAATVSLSKQSEPKIQPNFSGSLGSTIASASTASYSVDTRNTTLLATATTITAETTTTAPSAASTAATTTTAAPASSSTTAGSSKLKVLPAWMQDDVFWGKPNKHNPNGSCPCCE